MDRQGQQRSKRIERALLAGPPDRARGVASTEFVLILAAIFNSEKGRWHDPGTGLFVCFEAAAAGSCS